jgi:hypothetical protein
MISMFKQACYGWLAFFRPFHTAGGHVLLLILLYLFMTIKGIAEQERQLVLGAILALMRPNPK